MKAELLVRIGNTRVCGLSQNRFRYWTHEQMGSSDFKNWLLQYDSLTFASVVPSLAKKIFRIAKGLEVCEITLKHLPSLPLAYRGTLGIDRALNLLRIQQRGLKQALVIDIGTAITVEFWGGSETKPRHLGGWIAAGPGLLAAALHQKTAMLPTVDLKRRTKLLPGRSTAACLIAGQQAQLEGVILSALQTAKKIIPGFQIVVTGGGAANLSPALFKKIRVRHEPEMGLQALKEFLNPSK